MTVIILTVGLVCAGVGVGVGVGVVIYIYRRKRGRSNRRNDQGLIIQMCDRILKAFLTHNSQTCDKIFKTLLYIIFFQSIQHLVCYQICDLGQFRLLKDR